MASVAFATQELFGVCTNTSATSSTENWWVFAQRTEKRIFLSTFTCWRLTRLTRTRFEAKRPRPERTERRKGAAKAQRGERPLSVYVAPLGNWRWSAKVVPVERGKYFLSERSPCFNECPFWISHDAEPPQFLRVARCLMSDLLHGRNLSRFASVIGIGRKQAGQVSLKVRVWY